MKGVRALRKSSSARERALGADSRGRRVECLIQKYFDSWAA
jgi:hypothetical protein